MKKHLVLAIAGFALTVWTLPALAQNRTPSRTAPSRPAPVPTYRAPTPTYRPPAPVYRAPTPTYRPPAPVYRAPTPTYRPPIPTPSYTPRPSTPTPVRPSTPSYTPSYRPPTANQAPFLPSNPHTPATLNLVSRPPTSNVVQHGNTNADRLPTMPHISGQPQATVRPSVGTAHLSPASGPQRTNADRINRLLSPDRPANQAVGIGASTPATQSPNIASKSMAQTSIPPVIQYDQTTGITLRQSSNVNDSAQPGDTYSVSLGRRMDASGKTNELYGVYSSKADADNAVAEVKAWAARIRQIDADNGVASSNWDITTIQVDRTGSRPVTNASTAPNRPMPPALAQSFQRDLEASRALLRSRQAEIQRWDAQAQANFRAAFGTTDPAARRMILDRINRALTIDVNLTPSNLRPAEQSQRNRFAYVYPNDPTRIYLDQAYYSARPNGVDSRPGVLLHEISHFLGTQDIVYGQKGARQLAQTNPNQALQNADNFEYYMEGAARAAPPRSPLLP